MDVDARAYRDAACDLDPLSEELARLAMHAAARVGDAQAIRDRLAVLRRELDDASIDLDTEQLAADLLRDLTTDPQAAGRHCPVHFNLASRRRGG